MSEPMGNLAEKTCKPCEGGVPPLTTSEIAGLLTHLDGWSHRDGVISKTFTFKNYWRTMAFVNATAWISHQEDHHPVLNVGYKTCRVDYSTHAINGLSENDFICAAKVDRLIEAPS